MQFCINRANTFFHAWPPLPLQCVYKVLLWVAHLIDVVNNSTKNFCTPVCPGSRHLRGRCSLLAFSLWIKPYAVITIQYLALVAEISLVTNQHDDDIAAALRTNVVNPLGCLMEWIRVWNFNQYKNNIDNNQITKR